MVWCHFSYTNVSCQVFVDDSVFETIHKNMDNKIAELYAATGSKGKGRRNNQPGKGKGKGVSATLDTPFDPRDPFWMKFIRVSWKMTTRSTQPCRKKPRLSSLKTLVPECCCKLQRANSTSKIAKADKYCKMNNWKQARWHSCFNRWARLRPVVLPTFAPVPDVAPNSQPHPTHLLSPPTHVLWNCPVLMDHPSS